jgi:hypothetical protein
MEFRPDSWTDVALLLVRCLRHAHGAARMPPPM